MDKSSSDSHDSGDSGDSDSYIIFPTIDENLLTILHLNESNNPNLNAPGGVCSLTNEQLQKKIYNYGPVIGTINNKSWCSNSGQTVWANEGDPFIGNASDAISKGANHTIIIIGWGTASTSKKYWIIQNSWGKKWAYKGCCAIFWNSTDRNSDGSEPTKPTGSDEDGLCAMFNSIAHVDHDAIEMNLIKNTPGWKTALSHVEETGFESDTFITGPRPVKIATASRRGRMGGLVVLPQTLKQFVKNMRDIRLGLIAMSASKVILPIAKDFEKYFCWSTKDNRLKRSIMGSVQDQGKCESCWIFDCLDILASSIAMKDTSDATHKVVQFSAQKFISNLHTTARGGACQAGGALETFNSQVKKYPLYSNSLCSYKNMTSCDPESGQCDTNTDCDQKCNPKRKSDGAISGYHKGCCIPKSKTNAKTSQTLCNNICTGDADGPSTHPYTKVCEDKCDCDDDGKADGTDNSKGGLGALQGSGRAYQTWNAKTIVFLILTVLCTIPGGYQLFGRFRNGKKINYNILAGSLLLVIISCVLFVFYFKHII